MPSMLAMAASESIKHLTNTPSVLTDLHTNIFALRSVLDKVDCIIIPSHPASAIIHIHIRHSQSLLSPESGGSGKKASSRPSNPTALAPRDAVEFDIEAEERLLQEVVDEGLSQGVLITRAQRVHGLEVLEPRPSIRIAATSALTRKETEKAAGVVRSALIKVLGRR